jgi:NTE family protein
VRSSSSIGLALGGGGARGIAHIVVVEALDELGLKPVIIAGTSIGGIIGAAYAAGISGAEIRAYVTDLFRHRSEVMSRFWQLRPKRVRDLFSEGAFSIGQFDAVRVLETFLPRGFPADFADLKIPLKLVATDFYGWQEAVLAEGPLIRAIAASIAIPVLFRPVVVEGRVMIDGGVSNPLPFDLVSDSADLVIAVDAGSGPISGRRKLPGAADAVFGSMQIFMRSITKEKLRVSRPPEILLRPPFNPFRALEFMKSVAILKSAEPLKDDLKRQLDAWMAG